MAYATVAELQEGWGEDVLLQLTDRDRDGAADPGVAETALDDASAEMDGYLGRHYQLPLPDEQRRPLRRIAIDIAVYRLSTDGAAMTKDRRRRYEDALRFLRGVADGRIRLGADGGPDVGAALPQTASIESRSRLWDRAYTRRR